MDKKQFGLFASALRTFYPKENILPNEQAAKLWYSQLQDIPYEIAEVVLNKWVAINKWSPSISEIRQQAAQLTLGELKDWGEAWETVMYAIRHYGSYQVQEALDSFDPATKKAVDGLGGFLKLCQTESDKMHVERANFRDLYNQAIEREKERAQLPPRVKELMATMPLMLEEGAKNEE